MKQVKRCFIALALCAVVICLLPVPWRVQRDLTGYYWNEDGTQEELQIHVEGWYFRSLVLDNRYSGWLTISEEPLTQEQPVSGLRLAQRGGSHCTRANMRYDAQANRLMSVGELRERHAFAQVAGYLGDGRFYAASAGNAEEAQELFGEIYKIKTEEEN